MSFFNSVFPSRLDENDPIHETSKTSLKIVIQFVTLARPKCLNVKSQISLVLIRILFLFVGQGWTFLFFCLFKLKTFLCIFLGLSSSRFSLSLLAGPICFNLHVKYATLLEFFSCPRLVVFCLPQDRHSFIKARYIHELALFLADSFKVAQNSFQRFSRRRFWWAIFTTVYHLMLQSWYQKTAQSLVNTLVLFSCHYRLP